MTKKNWWEKLSDNELLKLKFSDLELKIEGFHVKSFFERLYKELQEKGILFEPHMWLILKLNEQPQ